MCRPLHLSHVLLAEREETLRKADTLVTVEDLPNVKLLVLSLVACLPLLLSDNLWLAFIYGRLGKAGLFEGCYLHCLSIRSRGHLPPKLGL